MALQFKEATKASAKLRMALIGVSGAGKTYTALNIAKHLAPGPIAVLDTEHGSASKYSDLFDFDVLELESFSPETYVQAIQVAEDAGYRILIIDSLSHAWTGKAGALEQVDRAAKRSQSSNTFGAWRDVTPMHNAMIEAIIGSRMHIIATMRAKTEYVQERNEKGRTTVRKVGMAPVQRDGLEYEFDVVADLDMDNNLIIGKTRCPAIAGEVIHRAGKGIARKLAAWLSDGVPNVEAMSPVPDMEPTEVQTTAPSEETEVMPPEIDDTPLCHCKLPARFIKSKSGTGYVCAQDTAKCDFRQKATTPAPEAAV